MQGVVLAATFAVSHNIEEAKPLASGSVTTSNLLEHYAERDWGVQQVCSFFTALLHIHITANRISVASLLSVASLSCVGSTLFFSCTSSLLLFEFLVPFCRLLMARCLLHSQISAAWNPILVKAKFHRAAVWHLSQSFLAQPSASASLTSS